ncbi:MAG: HEAT repeat domain-containing protein [Rhodospirillales bacterium]|nr:HEAT repeat domain-containing protein [Rhodospirillales bacterium]
MEPLTENQRIALAKIGHPNHLDDLVNDPNWWVRKQVVSHGNLQHLDKLVNDSHEWVRLQVAKQGQMKHLDKLVNDPHWEVRNLAKNKLKELKMSNSTFSDLNLIN